jgi:hypothetical protein
MNTPTVQWSPVECASTFSLTTTQSDLEPLPSPLISFTSATGFSVESSNSNDISSYSILVKAELQTSPVKTC